MTEISESEILERLSALEHDQWITLTKYFIEALEHGYKTGYTLGSYLDHFKGRYYRLLSIPYKALWDDEKEKDRIFARKVLELVKRYKIKYD